MGNVVNLVCRYMHSTPEGKDPTICGTKAPLPPDFLRGIGDETVKAHVGCLVTDIFCNVTTIDVICSLF